MSVIFLGVKLCGCNKCSMLGDKDEPRDKERRMDAAGARTLLLTLLQPHVLMPLLVMTCIGGVWLCSGPSANSDTDLLHFHELRLAKQRQASGGAGIDEHLAVMSAAEARARRELEPLPPPDELSSEQLTAVTGGKVTHGDGNGHKAALKLEADGSVDCFQFTTCAACRENECGWCVGNAWCVKDEPNICEDQFDHIGYASDQLQCPADGPTAAKLEQDIEKTLRAQKILPPE